MYQIRGWRWCHDKEAGGLKGRKSHGNGWSPGEREEEEKERREQGKEEEEEREEEGKRRSRRRRRRIRKEESQGAELEVL